MSKAEILKAIEKAQLIFNVIYCQNPDLDEIWITDEEVCCEIPSGGFSSNREYEFPLEYIDLSIEEIRLEIKKEQEKQRIRRLERDKELQIREIEDCKRLIKSCSLNATYYKNQFKQLTGEEYKEE